MVILSKQLLNKIYLKEGKSASEIASQLNMSVSKINYWLIKYKIPKRSISEAVYRKLNPKGDPFQVKKLLDKKDFLLFGMGIGLYWGEGTKANKYSVRLGNSDPLLIKTFIIFLNHVYGVDKKDLKFGLQIFSSMNKNKSLAYWTKCLCVNKDQFYKVIVTPSKKRGTYRVRNIEGVVTVYFNNVKLRNEINDALKKTVEDISILY